jgi:hypothetical protein
MNGKSLWTVLILAALVGWGISAIWKNGYTTGFAQGLRNWTADEMLEADKEARQQTVRNAEW